MQRRFLGLGRAAWSIVGGAVVLFGATDLYFVYRAGEESPPAPEPSPVELELKAVGPSHPWAGFYERTDGLTGSSIILAPRAGWTLTEFGDGGPWSTWTGKR